MSADLTPTPAQVRAAAAELKDAVDAHLAAVEKRTGENDPGVQRTYDQLREAGLAYDDVLFDVYEEVTPFEVPEVDLNGVTGEVTGTQGPPERVGVMTRHDFSVTDYEAVLDAGRQAYRAMWPDEGEAAAEEQVSHVGAAVYELANAYGLDGMEEKSDDAGLVPEGSTTWVLDVGEATDGWRDEAFTSLTHTRLLYRLDEVYDDEEDEE